MKKNILIGVAITIVICLFLMAGFSKPKEITASKVGVLAPLTGIVAQYGEEMQKGIIASNPIHAEFIFEDDKCQAKDALTAFKKLTDLDGVKMIVGPLCGAPQEAIAPLLKDKDVLVLSPSAASRDLFNQSGGNFYNLQYALEDESKFMAEKLFEKDLKNVVLISYQNAFSKVHSDSFKKHFKGNIVKDIVFAQSESDVSTEIAKLREKKIDAIFVVDMSFFFAQGYEKLEQYGINSPVYSTYVVELPAVRPLVEGVIYSFPGDISDGQGAVLNLSKEAAELADQLIADCGNDTACLKEKLMESGKFDSTGISTRSIILKQIKNGELRVF